MQKFLIRACAVTAALFVAVFIGTALAVSSKSDSETLPSETSRYVALYTLGEYDGKIALFKKGGSMPIEIYDVFVSSLPEEEKDKIREGINADSDGEILKIIEDYTS